MGKEIDLLINYPKSKRDLKDRAINKTEYDKKIAREFGKDFFDGDRNHGYGGFSYNPKFWNNVIPSFEKYWNLSSSDSVLDVGCAKGFMLYDFKRLIKGLKIKGIDISKYAIENSLEQVKEFVSVGDAKNLNFGDKEFDYVISINTVHNLEIEDCKKALKEISRVAKKGSFITVDAYRNEEEKKRMYEWNLTAKTILSIKDWKNLFKEINFDGDYYWFIP